MKSYENVIATVLPPYREWGDLLALRAVSNVQSCAVLPVVVGVLCLEVCQDLTMIGATCLIISIKFTLYNKQWREWINEKLKMLTKRKSAKINFNITVTIGSRRVWFSQKVNLFCRLCKSLTFLFNFPMFISNIPMDNRVPGNQNIFLEVMWSYFWKWTKLNIVTHKHMPRNRADWVLWWNENRIGSWWATKED